MRRIPYLTLVLMTALVAGCGADKASHDRDEYAAAGDAATAAADAAMAAADSADAASDGARGGNAAALRQMGVGHLAREFLGDVPEANYSRVVQRPMERQPNTGEQAMLAYEHEVEIRLNADKIAAKVITSKQACESGKFGACLVLEVSQKGGRYPYASLRVRAEPKAVEPLIVTAGEGGDIGERNTRALKTWRLRYATTRCCAVVSANSMPGYSNFRGAAI